jgi:hypothetical protein
MTNPPGRRGAAGLLTKHLNQNVLGAASVKFVIESSQGSKSSSPAVITTTSSSPESLDAHCRYLHLFRLNHSVPGS